MARVIAPTGASESASTGFAKIFPRMGWAALEAGEVVSYVTWCALREHAPAGEGRLSLKATRAFIIDWRRIHGRSAARVLRTGEKQGYWRVVGKSVFLTSSARLLLRFNLDSELAPHLVPLNLIPKPTAMKAHLYATVHEIPGHDQRFRNGPLARSTKEQSTGVPESTQRRYDKYATELVQQCFAEVKEDPNGNGVARVGEGYFIGRDGRQMRRLADYRVPKGHIRASKTAAKHAVRKARVLRERADVQNSMASPVVSSRGSSSSEFVRPARSFFAEKHTSRAQRLVQEGTTGPLIFGRGTAGAMKFIQVEVEARR